MAKSIRDLVRKLAGQPEPVPPGTGQRIQEEQQAEARAAILRQADQTPEHRWSGR